MCRFENACPKCAVSKSGAQKTPFSTTSQLNGNFNSPCFGTKHDIHSHASALETTWTLVHKRLKIGSLFYPPYVNSPL